MRYSFRKKTNRWLVRAFDAAGSLVKRMGFFSDPASGNSFHKILIFRLDHIGDIFMSTPVPEILKANHRGARISVLTSRMGAALLQNNPYVDEVIVYDAPWFARDPQGRNQSPSLFALAASLKKKGFDLAISLRGDLRENLIMTLAGIPVRVGYGITGGGFLLTHQAEYDEKAHETEHIKGCLGSIGIKLQNSPFEPKVYFNEEESTAISARLAKLGIRPDRKFIGLQVDAGTSSKEWPLEHFIEFLTEFFRSYPDHWVLLVGSNAKRGAQISQTFTSNRLLDLTAKTTLRELCFLFNHLKGFVGPDSGPTHLMAGLGVPTVFLFSGTNVFTRWKPLSDKATVLRYPVDCSPCHLAVCAVPGHPCLTKIGPAYALEALADKL